MSFRFFRRIKILPGVILNISKKGISTSIGTRGAKITLGQKHKRATVGIPGTGLSYSATYNYGKWLLITAKIIIVIAIIILVIKFN